MISSTIHIALRARPPHFLRHVPARNNSPLVEKEKVEVTLSFPQSMVDSHIVGPMRTGKIFIVDLQELQMLEKKVKTVKMFLPTLRIFGLEGSDPETVDTGTTSFRYKTTLAIRTLHHGGIRHITFDMACDMLWR
ncbi:hypothetical protein P692DRAFT_20875163 [Suillus brevipes Sb2]|nr:hypothetical protein P692DRAFT_20875163 [Suillus brevipes Sb2]